MLVWFWPPPENCHPKENPLAYLGWIALQVAWAALLTLAVMFIIPIVRDTLTNWRL
jgi:hypothetical protein